MKLIYNFVKLIYLIFHSLYFHSKNFFLIFKANIKKKSSREALDFLNKNRDFWMSFALTILKTNHKKYIKNPKNIKSEFMTIGFDTISKKYNKIIAGTHIYDQTVRPQILEKSQNEKYFSLIKEFEKITGVPALLNTSLNLHGNPVSSTLEDVIYTFKNSGLTYLYINDNFLVQKLKIS
tara:strand:+ start:3669 stop:4205 length:537 start_codon:yes stop_codon:yes gene_type:complete